MTFNYRGKGHQGDASSFVHSEMLGTVALKNVVGLVEDVCFNYLSIRKS